MGSCGSCDDVGGTSNKQEHEHEQEDPTTSIYRSTRTSIFRCKRGVPTCVREWPTCSYASGRGRPARDARDEARYAAVGCDGMIGVSVVRLSVLASIFTIILLFNFVFPTSLLCLRISSSFCY
jgi:hypothetical protein